MILFVKIIESVSGLLCVPYQESKKVKEKNKTWPHGITLYFGFGGLLGSIENILQIIFCLVFVVLYFINLFYCGYPWLKIARLDTK